MLKHTKFCSYGQMPEENQHIGTNVMAKELKNFTKRSDNYSQWYNELVVKADLAEQSAVRGCMVIKPHGYAITGKDATSARRHVQKPQGTKTHISRSSSLNRSSAAKPTMWKALPRNAPW